MREYGIYFENEGVFLRAGKFRKVEVVAENVDVSQLPGARGLTDRKLTALHIDGDQEIVIGELPIIGKNTLETCLHTRIEHGWDPVIGISGNDVRLYEILDKDIYSGTGMYGPLLRNMKSKGLLREPQGQTA